jgi:UDP-N-acetylglucosamine acyltransferase
MPRIIAQPVSIDPRAEIDDDVSIGPFSVIGPHARIGRGTIIENNVTITGKTTIGERNHIFPGAVIGAPPQDISYRGGDTRVVIGDDNIFRECTTVNRASEKEDWVTTIGDHNYFMAGAHVAHDCRVGNHIVVANASLLGGHVQVHDFASISGGCAVHHYVTIGRYAFIGGLGRVVQDMPPYILSEGHPARPRCINIVALKRNNFPNDVVRSLSEAHRLIYRAKVGLDHARELLRSNDQLLPQVNELLSFVQGQQEGRHGRGREGRRAAA